MKPISFKEQNSVLLPPPDMTDHECGPLPIYRDGKTIISCWQMSWGERLAALLFGKVWVGVLSMMSQPPIWLACWKSAFKKGAGT